MKILAINPGSTSTKIAVFDNERPLLMKTMPHSAEEVAEFPTILDQYDMRKQLILSALRDADFDLDFKAVIGRGSLAKPVEGGIYRADAAMVEEARHAKHQHACDLGCILANDIASMIPGCISLTADPGVVDELCDEARISGSPHCPRICIWHALNQRAIARRYAASIGTTYDKLNLIVCHLGGGISVGAHLHGRCVDVGNSLDGEGPFSPERAGTLPAGALIELCFSGKLTKEQLLRRIAGKAGLTAHLGTNDVREIVRRIEAGDKHAELIVDAMCYHTAKAIAAQGAVLRGKVDAIILTGGMANSDYITSRVVDRVGYLAPVHIYPGEDEMEALALNALAALRDPSLIK